MEKEIIVAIIGGVFLVIAALIQVLFPRRERSAPETPAEDGTGEKKRKKIRTGTKILAGVAVIFVALALVLGLVRFCTQPQGLPFNGWSTWGDITAVQQDNTVTLNGEVTMAGYYTITMDMSMRGKTVVLVLENTDASEFSNNCLIKITVNKTDDLVKPEGINTFALDEYVPYGNNRITFPLPANFDGKLGFVFMRAKLKNLKITVFYR